MAPFQQFRCLSHGVPRREATIETKFDKRSNRGVIRWDCITRTFPGATNVLRNDTVVDFECDSDMEELVPRRIAAYPDEVLEVIVADQNPTGSSQSRGDIGSAVNIRQDPTQGSVEAISVGTLTDQVNQLAIVEPGLQKLGPCIIRTPTGTNVPPTNTLYMVEAFQHTINSGVQTIIESQRHQTNTINECLSETRAELSAEIAKGNALQLESSEKQDRIIKLQEEMKDMQEKMKDMQQQALDRLAIIQGRIQTVITQNYELLEYPIPRLFIILPREPRFRDRFNPFTVPFRLYFLCECGAHTMNDSTSSPHKIHIAKHEGYDIDQPTEFLEKYGPYILAVLQMIKYSTAMATAVVPALAIADVSEQVKLASESIKHFKENFKDLVDDAISILQSKIEPTDLTHRDEGHSEFNGVEALEGADLRQLESYLKNKDSARTLGNLYRVVTNEGHVKWVCLDHYRENYKEVARKQLQEVVESNGGEFDENEGKISIDLESRILARQFYDALQRTRGVHDLTIGLLWDVTLDDLRQLETAVRVSNISILKLEALYFSGPASDVLNRGRRFDPLIDIMTNGRTRHFELVNCSDFFKRISRFPQGGYASTLQYLILYRCSVRTTKDIVNLFEGLPSLKKIRIQQSGVEITLSGPVSPPDSSEGRILDNQPSSKFSKLDDLMINFDDWSDLNIVHLEAGLQTISKYGLHRILSRNQQLETLITRDFDESVNLRFSKDILHILQKIHHPLRRLVIYHLPRFKFDSEVSYDFNQGRIISMKLENARVGTIDFKTNSSNRLYIWIKGENFRWQPEDIKDELSDLRTSMSVLNDMLPNIQVHEISCSNLSLSFCSASLREILAFSKGSLAKITLASTSASWLSGLSDDELKNEPFPNLTHFKYHYADIAALQLISDGFDIGRLTIWLSGFLPLKTSQQTRQQKMSVELKKIDMRFGSWDRLLVLIDFQSINDLNLTDCIFSEEILSILEVSLVNADLDLCIDGVKGISPERKDFFIESFQHTNIRIK